MKKLVLRMTCAALTIATMTAAVGCNGGSGDNGGECKHSYTLVTEKEAQCDAPGWIEHYECGSCGQVFVKGENDEYLEANESELSTTKSHTWLNGKSTPKVSATCTEEGVKAHYYCTVCEKYYILQNGYHAVTEEELKIEKLQHKYTAEEVLPKYLYADATNTSPAKYQKSCTYCGAVKDNADVTESDLFSVGKTLDAYQAADRDEYKPRSLSVTLYDAESVTYGFTWNTDAWSLGATLYYCVGSTFDLDSAVVVPGYSEKFSSFEQNNNSETEFDYYVSKADVQWQPNTTYSYRVADRYVGNVADMQTYTVKTVNPTATSFTFSHLSDTQTKENSGATYGKVLNQITSGESAFVVHTGDVVEYSRYEDYWTQMLDTNAQYLSKIPVMVIAGNHDATYLSGNNSSETYKHFHYALPKQDVGGGIYYAFTYGKVRFIMLNANFTTSPTQLPTAQYNWLKAELAASKAKEDAGELDWTIVSMHNPIYSAGKWGSDPSRNQIAMGLKKQLCGLFESYGVDLVLQGHDHCVTKRVENGVTYLMNGTAGTSAGSFFTGSGTQFNRADYDYALQGSHTTGVWAEITVSASAVSVQVKQLNGSSSVVKQQWTMNKR